VTIYNDIDHHVDLLRKIKYRETLSSDTFWIASTSNTHQPNSALLFLSGSQNVCQFSLQLIHQHIFLN